MSVAGGGGVGMARKESSRARLHGDLNFKYIVKENMHFLYWKKVGDHLDDKATTIKSIDEKDT